LNWITQHVGRAHVAQEIEPVGDRLVVNTELQKSSTTDKRYNADKPNDRAQFDYEYCL